LQKHLASSYWGGVGGARTGLGEIQEAPPEKMVKEQEGLPNSVMKLGGEPKISSGFEVIKKKEIV